MAKKKKLTNMLESKLTDKFRKLFKMRHSGGFIYKIPDTMSLGGKKPFDMFIILDDFFFCLEFKRADMEIATPFQDHNLNKAADNGAISRIVNEENMNDILEEIMEIVNRRKNDYRNRAS